MSDVVITVRGEHEERIAPEEGVAHLTLRAEGSERGAVVERIVALSEPVRDDLAGRKAQGSVSEWSSQRVSVWANRPWNTEGKQLALVHHASVEFTATFTDFAALSWWVADVSERDGVQIDAVTWRLTPATRAATEAAVATQAVSVAVARATAYASAIGLATVVPLEIADVGLLARPDSPAPAPMVRASMMMASDAGTGASFQFEPEDLVVASAVEARFSAR